MTPFTGTGRLLRLALRRDRIQLPIWVAGVALYLWVSIYSLVDLYPNESDLVALAVSSANSPVSLMTSGLVSGASLGATVTTQAFVAIAIIAGLMSTMAVVRHTRQNEETGRAELIGAGIVGRYAGLTAALLAAAVANLALFMVSTLLLIGYGLPAAGSLSFGAAVGMVGMVFAAVAAVSAQVAETARGANGIAAGAIGAAFLLRAIGDVSGKVVDGGLTVVSAWPSWLSPIGWAQQSRPFDRDQWWVLGLLAVFAVAMVTTAFALIERRDLGAGLREVRAGVATASPALLHPVGLAWRLHRGVLLGWAFGIAALSAVYGGVGDEVTDFVGDNPEMAAVIERMGGIENLSDAFLSAIMRIIGLAVALYAIQAMLRMRSEEAAGRVEPLLGTAVSRQRWMASNIIVGAMGTLGLLVLAGLSAGVAYGSVVGDIGGKVATLLGAAVMQAPAVFVMAGLAVVAFGLLPHWAAAISWAAMAAFFLLAQLGWFLELPQAVLDLSPFTHVPAPPADEVTALPLLALLAVAVALTTAGIAAFRRRDVALP